MAWPTGANGLAVGAEDTGIRPRLLIAQGKDLFKLGGSKPTGLQRGALGRICRGSRQAGQCLRGFTEKYKLTSWIWLNLRLVFAVLSHVVADMG